MTGEDLDVYQRADIYDAFYRARGKDYAAEAATVSAQILSRQPTATSLLDIACGPGTHLRCFAESFEVVEGLELSESMLRLARNRLPGIRFHAGDMRQFQLEHRFDAVTCMFSSIGHLETAQELAATLGCWAAHLRPGGVLVVEPWWFPETFLPGYVTSDLVTEDGLTIARMSHSARDGATSRMQAHYLVADSGSGIRHFAESHEITLFTQEQYETAFAAAGCTVEYVVAEPVVHGLFVGVRRD